VGGRSALAKNELLLRFEVPERTGALMNFLSSMSPNWNISLFHYRNHGADYGRILVGLQVPPAEMKAFRRFLKTLDLSDNEMAKWHVRHMVGGRPPGGRGEGERKTVELLYRFEFPERPGALARFLSSMRSDWNISLFHYRNHGADYGRVLVGIQVPRDEMRAFRAFLDKLGYPYADETRNPAYRLFLG
jgi:threonine dehydratase